MISVRTFVLLSVATSVEAQFGGWLSGLLGGGGGNSTSGNNGFLGALLGNRNNTNGGGFFGLRNPNRTTVRQRVQNARLNITNRIIDRIENATGLDIPDWIGNPDVGLVGSSICNVAVTGAEQVDAVSEFVGEGAIDCACGIDGGYANLQCAINSEICVEEGICGTVDLTGKYSTRGQDRTYTTTGCFDLTTEDIGDYKDFCVKLGHSWLPDDLQNPEFFIYSCDMWAKGPDGPERCNFCQSCGGDTGIQFDCSNVDLDNSPDANFTIPSDPDSCMALLGGSSMNINGNVLPLPQFVTP